MDLEKYMLPCLSKYFFEFDCPGCGFQRSLVALLKGDFVLAFKLFPAIFTTLIFFIICIVFFTTRKSSVLKYLVSSAIINMIIMMTAYFIKLNQIINY